MMPETMDTAVIVRPNDGQYLWPRPRVLYVGRGGMLRVGFGPSDSETITFTNVADHQSIGPFAVGVAYVFATGTTASEIVGFW